MEYEEIKTHINKIWEYLEDADEKTHEALNTIIDRWEQFEHL